MDPRIKIRLPRDAEFELIDELVLFEARTLRERMEDMPSFEAADPITIGAITLVVLQSVVPKILDVLAKREPQSKTLKISSQRGKESIEIECAGPITPEQISQVMQALHKEKESKP